jgi:hypothetical protein
MILLDDAPVLHSFLDNVKKHIHNKVEKVVKKRVRTNVSNYCEDYMGMMVHHYGALIEDSVYGVFEPRRRSGR